MKYNMEVTRTILLYFYNNENNSVFDEADPKEIEKYFDILIEDGYLTPLLCSVDSKIPPWEWEDIRITQKGDDLACGIEEDAQWGKIKQDAIEKKASVTISFINRYLQTPDMVTIIKGDHIEGDKIGGDKIAGNKITTFELPKQDLTALEKALTSFLRLYSRVADEKFMSQQDDIIRLGLEAGLIQNFEFTYELSWKAIKRWLKNNISPDAADGVTRRELFRMAAENLLIPDVTEWMTYHAARNEITGVEMGQGMMEIMGNFGHATQQLLIQLQTRDS